MLFDVFLSIIIYYDRNMEVVNYGKMQRQWHYKEELFVFSYEIQFDFSISYKKIKHH